MRRRGEEARRGGEEAIDVCLGLNYAIANMPEYSALEIHLINGEADTIVSLDELAQTEIVMLPPPSRTGRNNRECPRLTPQVIAVVSLSCPREEGAERESSTPRRGRSTSALYGRVA